VKSGSMSIEEVARLLEEMGDVHGVAFLLDSLAIKGVRQDYASCPIARLVQGLTGNPDAWAGPDWIGGGPNRERTTPSAASQFIRSFDRGGWPELEEAAS
jgi:hypothetical protein